MISKTATIGENVIFGEYCVVGDNVTIGNGCVIGNNVVIRADSKISEGVRIDDFVSIGKTPMKSVSSAVTTDSELPACVIESGVIIGTNVVIYRGAKIGEKTLIADLATVRENVQIGEKTIIGRGVTVENFCTIGSFTKIESNAYITAYSTVEDNCFIAPCVVTSNDNFAGRTKERFNNFKGVTVKKGARIGAGAVILPGKTIHEDGFVGAGSVVTRDVEARQIYCGNPAKKIREVPVEQLLENQNK